MKKDVFIVKNIEDVGYQCSCSLSTDYKELYKWLYTKSYKCLYENFPWDHFTFDDAEDEKEFLEIYGDSISYE